MIQKECKRLIEVDFPIAEVSKHSSREKSLRFGHPSTLHLWWARRPLAACRSVLLGLLLPDPCDENCPIEFITIARKYLGKRYSLKSDKKSLRDHLLKFIGEFSNWDYSTNPLHLEIARELVKAAHSEETPLVVDPFAGGGSIPLEALRLGCDTFASDLNPVACLINKVILEDIPRHGKELADELRIIGKQIKEITENELKIFYPADTDGSKPIAYLWARTAVCESPNCGCEIPLIRSFWLSKKSGKKRALKYNVNKKKTKTPQIEFEIFEPKNDSDVQGPLVDRAKGKCPACNSVLPAVRVHSQLSENRGGANNSRLLTIISKNLKGSGKSYRLPNEADFNALALCKNYYTKNVENKEIAGIKVIPNEPTPLGGGSGAGRAFSCRIYGMTEWGDLFTLRQKVAIEKLISTVLITKKTKYPNEILELLSLSVTKLAERSSSLVSWISKSEAPRGTFARQALPIIWDYLELVPFTDDEEYIELIEAMALSIETLSKSIISIGQIQQSDARTSPLPQNSADIWFTDPPYYDAIPYSELSDFFFVWLKRLLINHPFIKNKSFLDNTVTSKSLEIVQDETKDYQNKPKDKQFFELSMATAFKTGRDILKNTGIGCVVFAHKTTEGWEALLNGMMNGNWVITASWPIATERGGRLRANDSAALSSSIHLVCRPRDENAGVGDWGEILRQLPLRIKDWMHRLDGEGVHGADLVFSCIGPALELFSRFKTVETAEGKNVDLAEYLEKVWEVVGRTALEQVLGTAESRARNGATGVLEEDARLTALFLWTLMSSSVDESEDVNEEDDDADDVGLSGKKKGGYSLQYDVARRFAQPLGIDLDKWKGRVIESEKGIVRLISLKERSPMLFGEKSSAEIAAKIQRSPESAQMILFPSQEAVSASPKIKAPKKGSKKLSNVHDDKPKEATTLDRVHAAMLLQASGQSAALKALIEAEQKRSPDFVRLANALSALYPKSSEDKRLLDAMLLAVPRR